MKKIAAGYYEGEYNGIRFSIHKVEKINTSTRNKWYWKCHGAGGDDWESSKKNTVLAVQEHIDRRYAS